MNHLTADQVEEKLKNGEKLNLIDVREDEEVAAGKIPSAVHISLGTIESRMGEFDKDKEYILVCRSGARSTAAGQFLESFGYKITNMDGGMLKWKGEIE